MAHLPPRASDCSDLTTEDDSRTPITEGQRLFNYYDGKWGTVESIRPHSDGWFTFRHDDGTSASLNGVRVSVYDPRGSVDPESDNDECEVLVEVIGVASGERIGNCTCGRPLFRSRMAGTIYHSTENR